MFYVDCIQGASLDPPGDVDGGEDQSAVNNCKLLEINRIYIFLIAFLDGNYFSSKKQTKNSKL